MSLNFESITKIAVALTVAATTVFAQSPQLKAPASQVLTFVGATHAKLVFEDRGFLYFVDYSLANPAITKMTNTAGGVAPMISPDGNFITYATGVSSDGAMPGKGSCWICPLTAAGTPVLVADSGYNPRFIYNAAVPTVIYSTCGSNGNGFCWNGCGSVVKKTYTGGVLGAAEVVWAGGSYFGGLSYDGRYLISAEQNLNAYILDLQNPTGGPAKLMHLTFTNTATQIDTILDLQACNPSVSSSRIFTSTMMYLDFGFVTPGFTNPVLGSFWGLHDRIYIGNKTGAIVQIFDVNDLPYAVKGRNALANEISDIQFDDPEWTNHPYFSVSNVLVDRLRGSSGAWTHPKRHEGIYIMNCKDSLFLNVVQATDTAAAAGYATNLQWPWLWIETPANLVEDPAWLGTPVIVPYGSNSRKNGIHMANSIVTSDAPISDLTVHNLAGRVVFAQTNTGIDRSVVLTRSMFPVQGIYFVRITNVRGEHQVFRLSIAR